MNQNELRTWLKENVDCRQFLEKSKDGLFCCPFCNSGHGNNKTGALNYYEDTNTWHCFACDRTGDSIDLYMNRAGIDNFGEALPLMAKEYQAPEAFSSPETASSGSEGINTLPEDKTPISRDFSGFYEACRNQMNDPRAIEYLHGRGISIETAIRFGIGFDGCNMVIPVSKDFYIRRAIDPAGDIRYKNPPGIHPVIFNESALYSSDENDNIFVVEGAFDALSVEECGYKAISLNSTANDGKLLEILKAKPTKARLLIALDNDKTGKEATARLTKGFAELKTSFEVVDICPGSKDPNEALQKNKTTFLDALRFSTLSEEEKHRAENMRADFFRVINEGKRYSSVSTGLYAVDKQLGGGLFPGLYFLAALPGSGKTTLFLQFADSIAKNGRDVLFFSMEMAKEDIIARSISREAYSEGKEVSVTDILQGKVNVDPIAEKYFSTIGKHLSIYEGRKTADNIWKTVKTYTEKTGHAPVVFVDYLQLIDPEKRDVRESVNHSVDIFAKIRREFKTPVLVISSVSRSNYEKSGSESMFKESGEIEFSADCLLAYEYSEVDKSTKRENPVSRSERITNQTKAAKRKDTRAMKLSLIKNRFSGFDKEIVNLNYVPKCNHFSVPR